MNHSSNAEHCANCKKLLRPGRMVCERCGHNNLLTRINAGIDSEGKDGTILLEDVKSDGITRFRTGLLDDLWGTPEGLANIQVIALGGTPGAGKSTICLQLARSVIDTTGGEALYVAAEEREDALKERAVRIGLSLKGIRIYPIGNNFPIDTVLEHRKPRILFIDSIQRFVPDINLAVSFAKKLKEDWACKAQCPIFLISQVNKAGDFSGLEAFQHEVDTTAFITQAEGGCSPMYELRTIGTFKNRFGATGQKTVRMTPQGIVYHESDNRLDLGEDDET